MIKSDSELIDTYLKGEEYAFAELVERHMKALYAFVWHSVKDEALASDVIQEVWIKVWRHLKRFDTTQSFVPWLFAIARRTTIDHVRKRSPVAFSVLDQPEQEQFEANIPDPAPLPDELFDHSALSEELERALDTLPLEQKMIVLLHHHNDMTFEEIAIIVKRPMNTVKSIYRRALIKLRGLLLHQN